MPKLRIYVMRTRITGDGNDLPYDINDLPCCDNGLNKYRKHL